jgi:aromatic ring-cleaving dioxygenase
MRQNRALVTAVPPAGPEIIRHYHAHVYYDPVSSRGRAARLRERVASAFPDATLGRWHDAPVGDCKLDAAADVAGRRAPARFHFSSKNSSVPSPWCGDCPGNLSVIGLSKRVYQGFFDIIAAAVFMMND